jgi:hypothetical protein
LANALGFAACSQGKRVRFMTTTALAQLNVIAKVVSQHAEEASMLWLLRMRHCPWWPASLPKQTTACREQFDRGRHNRVDSSIAIWYWPLERKRNL